MYPYPPEFLVRFVLSHVAVSAIAFWFEHLGETSRTGMEMMCLEQKAMAAVIRGGKGQPMRCGAGSYRTQA